MRDILTRQWQILLVQQLLLLDVIHKNVRIYISVKIYLKFIRLQLKFIILSPLVFVENVKSDDSDENRTDI